jgi:uncharacterized protein (DUF305 family)
VRSTARLVVPAAAAVIVLALSACGSSDDSPSGSMMSGSGNNSASMSAGTSTGAKGDVEFAQMMIPHHEQAVEMADLALQNDSASADVKALATQIKAAQDPEIKQMTVWLSQWGAAESSGPMGHGSGGMQDDQDMTALKDASGADFDRMWLTMMIAHHQGAVTMAQDVLATTAHAGVKEMANAIVKGQQSEIAAMQGMLG